MKRKGKSKNDNGIEVNKKRMERMKRMKKKGIMKGNNEKSEYEK